MRTRRQILHCFVPGRTPLTSLGGFILSVVDFKMLEEYDIKRHLDLKN